MAVVGSSSVVERGTAFAAPPALHQQPPDGRIQGPDELGMIDNDRIIIPNDRRFMLAPGGRSWYVPDTPPGMFLNRNLGMAALGLTLLHEAGHVMHDPPSDSTGKSQAEKDCYDAKRELAQYAKDEEPLNFLAVHWQCIDDDEGAAKAMVNALSDILNDLKGKAEKKKAENC